MIKLGQWRLPKTVWGYGRERLVIPIRRNINPKTIDPMSESLTCTTFPTLKLKRVLYRKDRRTIVLYMPHNAEEMLPMVK